MLAAVTALSLTPLASQGSSAGVGEPAVTSSALSGVNLASATVGHAAAILVRPRSCNSARKAVQFYSRRIAEHRARMGVPRRVARQETGSHPDTRCPRYLARVLQRKAYATRRAVQRWFVFHYDWRSWMPAFWRAIAVCESGQNPPNWEHANSSHLSAFGITVAEYDADAAYMGAPPWRARHTPRDQYRAARGHQARFGLGGWGCYTHGGYLVHLGRV